LLAWNPTSSYCILTKNDVEVAVGSDRHAATAFFVEMQCRNNVIAGNRLISNEPEGYGMKPEGYGMNLNSFLNFVVSNDLGSSGVKISGKAPYPAALSNRFIDNTFGR
jgi:hypothetical protein